MRRQSSLSQLKAPPIRPHQAVLAWCCVDQRDPLVIITSSSSSSSLDLQRPLRRRRCPAPRLFPSVALDFALALLARCALRRWTAAAQLCLRPLAARPPRPPARPPARTLAIYHSLERLCSGSELFPLEQIDRDVLLWPASISPSHHHHQSSITSSNTPHTYPLAPRSSPSRLALGMASIGQAPSSPLATSGSRFDGGSSVDGSIRGGGGSSGGFAGGLASLLRSAGRKSTESLRSVRSSASFSSNTLGGGRRKSFGSSRKNKDSNQGFEVSERPAYMRACMLLANSGVPLRCRTLSLSHPSPSPRTRRLHQQTQWLADTRLLDNPSPRYSPSSHQSPQGLLPTTT